MNTTVHLPAPVHASDLNFSGVVPLSNDPAGSKSPLLATAGSNVYAIWLNNTSGKPNVVFRASNNNGSSFGSIINLSNTPNGFSANPQIAALGTNVYVVWEDNSTGNENVFFRASTNNGASFNPTINLSHDTKNCDPFLGCLPQIAVSGTNVYVTWVNGVTGPSGSTDIFFVNSTKNGGSFTSTPVNLSGDKVATVPVIAAAGSNVYVAWQDANSGRNDLFFKASTNSGGTFGSFVNLSNNPASPVTNAISEQIAAVSNNVYVAWTNSTATDQTVFRASVNNGASFGSPILLSGSGAVNPKMTVSGSYVHLVWETHSGGNSLVSYSVSSNNGASFASTPSLSNSTGFALNPQVASNGTSVYVTWQDTTGNNDVYFRSSSDNGATFGVTLNLSSNTGFSVSPAVAARNKAYVAWQDDTPGNGAYYSILFRAGTLITIAPPIATPDSINSFENQTVPVLLSGTDPQKLPLVFSIVTMPTHGTLGPITQSAPNLAQVTYTPNLNYLGTDSFTFKVNNGSLNSSPATVTLTVLQSGVSTGSRWAD